VACLLNRTSAIYGPDGLLTNEADFNYLHAEAAGMQLLRAGRNRTGIGGERRADIWKHRCDNLQRPCAAAAGTEEEALYYSSLSSMSHSPNDYRPWRPGVR